MTHHRPTPKTLHALALALAAAWPAAAYSDAPRVTVQVLPAIGGSATFARDLNDAGQVVGQAVSSSTASAFVWSAGGGTQIVSTSTISAAVAINQRGQIAGTRFLGSRVESFVWDPVTGLRLLATPGDKNAYARDINDAGVVVGAWSGTFVDRAARWDAAGVMQELSSGSTIALGVNAAGRAVGGPNLETGGVGLATVWAPDGSATTLDATPGFAISRARAVNAAGQMAGLSIQAQTQATFWDASGAARALGTLGGASSDALALNDAGQVVGWARTEAGAQAMMLWRDGAGMSNLSTWTAGNLVPQEGVAINNHAQIAGNGRSPTLGQRAFLMTLHPDWTGGDGAWNDSTGTRWNWAGTGTAAARVGAMHDVVIDPGRSATVTGAVEGRARSLQIGGSSGTVVTLHLGGGTTALGDGDAGFANPSAVRSGGVVTGSGRLMVGETLQVQAGGRIEVGAGQLMQLQVDELRNGGRIQVLGTAAAPAELQTSGGRYHFTNDAPGQVLVQHGTLRLGGGLQNFGRVSLQSARLLADDTVLNHADAQLSFSFGDSVVDAVVDNRGLLVVSNGARASFHGRVDSDGELRISSGGAANFFGEVTIGGSFTGGGDAMFEGGLTLPFGTTVQMGPHTTLAGATLRLVGSAEGLGLGDRVDVFDWFTGVEGRFAALALPTLGAGLVWDAGDLYAGGTLAVAAVPEPSTWALLLAGLVAVSGLARRRL